LEAEDPAGPGTMTRSERLDTKFPPGGAWFLATCREICAEHIAGNGRSREQQFAEALGEPAATCR
jgi:hypothetical protein